MKKTAFIHKDRYGDIVYVSRPDVIDVPIDGRGIARTSLKRINFSDITASGDPSSRLVTGLADAPEGTGLGVTLSGSFNSGDWGASLPWYSGRIKDLNGKKFSHRRVSLRLFMRFRTPPGDSDDFIAFFCICNEADPTTATVDGKGMGIRFSGATRALFSTRVINGTVSNFTGGSATTNASVTTILENHGSDGQIPILTPIVVGLTSADAYNSTFIAHGSVGATLGASAELYFVLAYGRVNSANSSNATGLFDYYYSLHRDRLYPP